MTAVTVFGTGAMGSVIGRIVGKWATSLQVLGSGATEPVEGDVVVLAVPYEALETIAESHGDQLAGKVVVDVTNPLDFETFDALKVPVGSSAAAQLQARLPDARVVKAFNTTFAATVDGGRVGPIVTSVLLAGDDDAAKQTVARLVTAGGLDAVDVGGLVRAHELEALGFLQLTLAHDEKISWSGGFGLVR